MNLFGVITLCTVGSILTIGGIVLLQIFPSIMQSSLEGKLILSADSPTIGNFVAPPVPIFMQFYFFNITNKEAILDGEKAILKQIGPFTYEEKRLKYDLLWDETEDNTVTYRQNKTFFFREDLSVFSDDIEITTLNVPYLGVGKRTHNAGYFNFVATGLLGAANSHNMTVFITKPVRELLYEGYEENFFKTLSAITFDPVHATGRFGFFYPKNNSNDGDYRVFTGADGLDTLQLIDEWKEEPNLDFWSSEECNMINGTEGSQFPQPIEEDGIIWMFSSDLCRSLYLRYEKTVQHGGLDLYRYILPQEVLEKSEATACYCQDEFTCRSSMVNLAPCKKKVPIMASTPHFYMGTNDSILGVEGLSPNKEEHETYVDVEPNTGVTFRAHKRIQISFPVMPYSGIPQLENVQEVIFPILWLNESAVVPEERAAALHSKLIVPGVVAFYSSWVLVVVGLILVICGIVFGVMLCRNDKSVPVTHKNVKSKPLNMEEMDHTKSENFKHLYT